jgi:hypothetical protein
MVYLATSSAIPTTVRSPDQRNEEGEDKGGRREELESKRRKTKEEGALA